MRALSATLTLGLLLMVHVGGAAADSECVKDAKHVRAQCRMACDEDFVVTRDLCRNIDPECAAGCRAAKAECREVVVSALESCYGECRAQLERDRAACPRRGRGRDFCVDQAQIRNFLCKDECRESLRVRAALGECQDSFRACMNECGIPTAPTPAPTVLPTEVPHEPTAMPTPLRTATPVPTELPQPTATILAPR